jgi:hypothetical protein
MRVARQAAQPNLPLGLHRRFAISQPVKFRMMSAKAQIIKTVNIPNHSHSGRDSERRGKVEVHRPSQAVVGRASLKPQSMV